MIELHDRDGADMIQLKPGNNKSLFSLAKTVVPKLRYMNKTLKCTFHVMKPNIMLKF